MPVRPPTFRPRGQRSKAERQREHDARRGTASERGYDGRWAKASATHKRRHPFCQYGEVGAFGDLHVAAAEVTDHLFPVRVFEGVFWRTEWWVSACAACHNGPKHALEMRGAGALPDLNRLAELLARPAYGEGEG